MKPLTVCALFYGDYLDLAQRCLGSIGVSLSVGHNHVEEFRFGLNEVASDTSDYVRKWADECHRTHGISSHILETNKNVFKYPLMRRMFYDEPAIDTEFVMWFDDDSYFETPASPKWWDDMLEKAKTLEMIGQFWLIPLQGSQWEWIKAQDWFNPEVGPPKNYKGKPHFEFCQGAWWVIRNDVLRRYNWPVPRIRHNGGDSMLGELLRHQRLRMGRFYGGVRINADERGHHSKAKPRHPHENKVGWNYEPGETLDLSFQEFAYERTWTGPTQTDDSEIIDLFED